MSYEMSMIILFAAHNTYHGSSGKGKFKFQQIFQSKKS